MSGPADLMVDCRLKNLDTIQWWFGSVDIQQECNQESQSPKN